MATRRPPVSVDREALLADLDIYLNGNLGASPRRQNVAGWRKRLSPISLGVLNAAVYAVVACVLPFVVSLVVMRSSFRDIGFLRNYPYDTLALISFWGAGYLGFANVVARSSSARVSRLMRDELTPLLSDATCRRIRADLAAEFPQSRLNIVCLSVAAVAAAASCIAIYEDLFTGWSLSVLPVGESIAFSLGFFVLYVVSARTTDAARFYSLFAKNIEPDREGAYTADPSHSALIITLRVLSREVYAFWCAISASVLSLLFIFWLRPTVYFTIAVVPVATFFSLGVGTLVFLRSEADLATFVRRASSTRLREIERDIEALLARRSAMRPPEWARLDSLKALHASISASTDYSIFKFSSLSIIAPFLAPAISLAALFLHPAKS